MSTGGGISSTSPYYRGMHGTVSPQVVGMSPSVAGRPQGTVHSGVDARGAATE